MSRILLPCIGLLLVTVLAAAPARAAQNESGRQTDLVNYNQLMHQVRQLDRDYSRVMAKAMDVARANNGKADQVSMAELLSIRDKRDRLMTQLTMVALRHGWELPSTAPGSSEAEVSGAPRPPQQQAVFRPAEKLIQARFADEAGRIARRLRLPIVAAPGTEPHTAVASSAGTS